MQMIAKYASRTSRGAGGFPALARDRAALWAAQIVAMGL